MPLFINQFLLFIGGSLILVPLSKKLGFGSVLGYLLAGMVVGPYGLKLINDAQSVLHFAELGVVLLLFMIGLEVQPQKLKQMRSHLIRIGGSQILLSTLVFTGVALLFKVEVIPAIVLAFALSLSSTAFAMQTLTEKNQFNTEFGQASFSVLLMQDLVAIPALALIPVLGSQSINYQSIGTTFFYFLLLVGSLLLARKYLINPVFRSIASTRTREMFTAMTLFIVIGIAAVMQKIGLSAALGTFMAGVLLAESEYRHELETNLEPFKGLLMGLFFIAVGMDVNLNIIVDRPLIIILLALSYLVIKSLILYSIGRFFKLNHENSKQMSFSIAQGGEFAFVIFGIAFQSKLFNSELIELLTVIITLSMALNPVVNILNEKLQQRRDKFAPKPKYDDILNNNPQVIIAGFGRFGQMFGRVLKSQAIPFVAIDHDPESIEILRKFGNKVYYGDASRIDLLEAAGAEHAKYFILAIDDVEVSLVTANIVTTHFPHLKIFARARNRGHTFELMEAGITSIKRETFDSSINFVEELLIDMGLGHENSKKIINRFKLHDEMMLQEQFHVHKDDNLYMSLSNQSMAQLTQVFEDEAKQSYIDPQNKK